MWIKFGFILLLLTMVTSQNNNSISHSVNWENDNLSLLPASEKENGNENGSSRSKRGFVDGIWAFFRTVNEAGRIHNEQYNATVMTLNEIYDLLRNSFTDTATLPPPSPSPAVSTESNDTSGTTTSSTTTTERYQITRNEFGRILGRNYRGLRKLYRLELNDALNASQYNIKQYQLETKNAIANFATFD